MRPVWLTVSDVGAVLDATHPYAATITATASKICGELGIALLGAVASCLASRRRDRGAIGPRRRENH